MELYEVKNGLERARLLLNELFVSIDIEGLKREIEGLTVQTLDEHFWNNQEQAKKIYNQLNEMKKTTDTYDDLVSSLNDLDETYDYVKENIQHCGCYCLKDRKKRTNDIFPCCRRCTLRCI